jgi:hypothetical protein|tara:strand:- start:38 stop:223 length:186 start_codon:yes stop_codon:yes gene_type:complete
MTFTYKLIKNPMTGVEDGVRLSSDTDNIVKIIDIKNDSSDDSDYLQYKAWLDAGNTPEAAD